MNVLTILLAVLFFLILSNWLRRYAKSYRKPSQTSDKLTSWPTYGNFLGQDHPWGTTKMEPGDLTRIEEKLRNPTREKEE
jgi:hypothetical protein